jgi:hypothetical protein
MWHHVSGFFCEKHLHILFLLNLCPFSIFQFLSFPFIIIFFSSFCVALTHDMEDRPAAAISGQVAAGRASPGRA